MVQAPLARACFVLARQFGWTPDECAELTVGQVLTYLEMLGSAAPWSDSGGAGGCGGGRGVRELRPRRAACAAGDVARHGGVAELAVRALRPARGAAAGCEPAISGRPRGLPASAARRDRDLRAGPSRRSSITGVESEVGPSSRGHAPEHEGAQGWGARPACCAPRLCPSPPVRRPPGLPAPDARPRAAVAGWRRPGSVRRDPPGRDARDRSRDGGAPATTVGPPVAPGRSRDGRGEYRAHGGCASPDRGTDGSAAGPPTRLAGSPGQRGPHPTIDAGDQPGVPGRGHPDGRWPTGFVAAAPPPASAEPVGRATEVGRVGGRLPAPCPPPARRLATRRSRFGRPGPTSRRWALPPAGRRGRTGRPIRAPTPSRVPRRPRAGAARRGPGRAGGV